MAIPSFDPLCVHLLPTHLERPVDWPSFDTVSPPPPLSVQGRPRKIHHDAEEGVKEFIEQNPTAYQDEIVEFLASEFDISVHRTTVCRLLEKLGETHKRIERAAGERDDEERAHWRS